MNNFKIGARYFIEGFLNVSSLEAGALGTIVSIYIATEAKTIRGKAAALTLAAGFANSAIRATIRHCKVCSGEIILEEPEKEEIED